MVSNLISKFFKVAFFALVGNVVAAVGDGVANHQPVNLDATTAWLWPVIASAVAGAVAAVKRWVQWNPAKR